jgi:hypothetical protein
MMLAELEPRLTVAASGLDRLAQYAAHVENGQHRLRVLGEGFDLAEQLIAAGDEMELDRAAVLLTLCENVYRAFPIVFDLSLGRQLDAAGSGVELLAGLAEPLVEDLSALRLANADQIATWREQIDAGALYVPNPTFPASLLVGGADADWIVADALIDCKTVEKLAAPWLRETLLQMIAYTLLDLDDDLSIQTVAVWLPRQAAVMEWTLDALLGADAEKALPKLRDGFLAALRRGA